MCSPNTLIGTGDPHENSEATADAYKTLFVARVSYDTSERRLKRDFEEYGPVKKVCLVKDKDAKPRGYAFVEFEKEKDMRCTCLAPGSTPRSRFPSFALLVLCSALRSLPPGSWMTDVGAFSLPQLAQLLTSWLMARRLRGAEFLSMSSVAER